MGKFKPFLFGALIGAGAVFVALQYHVVQTHQGLRVVPRTPQHSLGLAFVDIRNWDAEQWADRPELARALVAHGSTDLVAGSVADGLMESVSSDSPIEQLRGFLNNSSSKTANDDPLYNAPGFLPIQKKSEASDPELDDLLKTPFRRDVRRTPAGDSVSTSENRTTVAKRPQSAIDDVFRPGSAGSGEFNSGAMGSSGESPAAATTSPTETELLEDMLFGDEQPASPAARSSDESAFGVFEDISSTLENRASEALQRARSGFRDETNRAVNDSTQSLDRYVRDRVNDSFSDSVSAMFSEESITPDINADATVPDAIKALRGGFDPFVE